jgi:hypothetical protein
LEVRRNRSWAIGAILFAGVGLLLPPLQAAGFEWFDASPQQLQIEAEHLEDAGQWTRAAELWYQVLTKDRAIAYVRQHHHYCLRRAQQVARQQDASYRVQVAALSLEDSLRVYAEVLTKLQADYVDQAKVQLPQLFKQGLDEIRFALGDEMLRQEYFADIPADTMHAFLASLTAIGSDRPIKKIADAQNLAREVALAATKSLGLKPSLVVLELACGACNGLDECTYYLTPRQFRELNASLKGEAVGIGVDLNPGGEIAQVMSGSPAQVNGLKKGDRIVRIANKPIAGLNPDSAAELLKGEPDSAVELEVASSGDVKPHTLKL